MRLASLAEAATVTLRQCRLADLGSFSTASASSSQSSAAGLACSGPNNFVTALTNARNSRSALRSWSAHGEVETDPLVFTASLLSFTLSWRWPSSPSGRDLPAAVQPRGKEKLSTVRNWLFPISFGCDPHSRLSQKGGAESIGRTYRSIPKYRWTQSAGRWHHIATDLEGATVPFLSYPIDVHEWAVTLCGRIP